MWFFGKDKPHLYVFKNGALSYNQDQIHVHDSRDETPIEPSQAMPTKSYAEAMNRINVSLATATILPEHPQDTIESLINRLIELGEPKPEVVITGEKRASGHESYGVSIDGEKLYYRNRFCTLDYYYTLSEAEKSVIMELKNRISKVVTETTTITY